MSKAVESYGTDAPIQPVGTEPDGPTHRVRLGVKRNESVTPELFPDRAVAVTKSFKETEGQRVKTTRPFWIMLLG